MMNFYTTYKFLSNFLCNWHESYYHCFFVYPYQPNSFYKQSEHYPRPGQGGRPSKCEVRRPRAASTSSLVVPKIRYNHRPSFLFQNTIIPTQLTYLACFNAHMKYHTLNSCERFGRASLHANPLSLHSSWYWQTLFSLAVKWHKFWGPKIDKKVINSYTKCLISVKIAILTPHIIPRPALVMFGWYYTQHWGPM